MKDKQLEVSIKNNVLNISIGTEILLHSITHSPIWYDELEITDQDEFLKELVNYLQSEDEDGTTPIHIMLDDTAKYAIEQGCFGIEEKDDE